ncbi:MAG: copper amine oxidase N-terminal domain-containing protein [Symbiobacterium sp.]|uniref:copper amine oxidase N-terminal domain-containing protein n=1 Tax=Symbiobacterium sp. TaxID=1971213 RepID=UPI0034643482
MHRGRTGITKHLTWLLLAMLLTHVPANVGAEQETRLEIAQYPDENYEPGPGWPDGWTPPPPPEGMSERMKAEVERVLREYPETYDRYDWWVWDPLPAWTQEYPYYWEEDWMGCGTTMHVYAYPKPDTQLIRQVFGRSFGWSRTTWKPCRYEPVDSISEVREMSEEEKAAEARGIEYEYWRDKSHPGLFRDDGRASNGNPDYIYVYLNQGNASEHFDVPAYLDTTVNRVRVPIRFISEMMGAEVSWDQVGRRVTIHFPAVTRKIMKAVPAPGYDYPDLFDPEEYLPNGHRFLLEERTVSIPERTITLTINHPVAVVDGKEVPLDAPPVIRNDRTMVPVRFIAEQMGAKVYWVGAEPIFRRDDGTMSGTYQVHIFTPFFPLYEYPSWYLENRAVRY